MPKDRVFAALHKHLRTRQLSSKYKTALTRRKISTFARIANELKLELKALIC